MLERSQARHGVESAEGVACHGATIHHVHVEAVAAAGRRLSPGKGDAGPEGPAPPGKLEEGTPAAAEVEHAGARADPELIGHERVFAPLRRFERKREVAVVHRAAEIGLLADAEAEEPVNGGVDEIEVARGGHHALLGASPGQPLPSTAKLPPALMMRQGPRASGPIW